MMKEKLLSKIKKLKKDLVEDCGISLAHVFVEIDPNVQKDSFYTDIGERFITIIGQTEADLFYGLLDLLQKVKTREILRIGLSESLAPERGLHVDCGRKYYTKAWFISMIDLMALNKLNILQMHFSEYLGYRIESKKFPEITSREHLTQKDIKEIINYAKEYYIDVVPSFDSPGHLEYVLKYYPEHQMPNLKTGINITSNEAREFIKSLYDEVLEIFDHTNIIHMGGDEFIDFNEYHKYPELEQYAKENISKDATAADTFLDYINDIGEYLMSKGKDVRIWNDGFYRLNIKNTLELNPNFVITHWTSWHKDMAPLQTFIDKNHRVINYNDTNLYYVVGENAGYTYPTKEKIEENFEIYNFSKLHKDASENIDQNMSVKDPQMIGSYFAIWSDSPEAKHETDIYRDLNPLLEVFGKKFWEFTN